MLNLRIPVATYRLQLNEQFQFENARELVPYLHHLGISHMYTSPIFKARKGSPHCYDVTDPTRLNPDLGPETDFDILVQELRKHNMELLLDIVPNHMAASCENPWWMNLMENGRCSPYAGFFDIDWSASNNKIILPLLAHPHEDALANQEFNLTLKDAGLFILYGDHKLPLDVKSYGPVLSCCLDALGKAPGPHHSSYEKIARLIEDTKRLPFIDNPNTEEARKQYGDRQAIKESFWHIIETSPDIKTALLQNISRFNGQKGETHSFEPMRNLLEQQAYRLIPWKETSEHINYRRFFDINDLIGVRVEELSVFETTHSLLSRMIREGKVSALRIDHIDGLSDPFQYLSRLQQCVAPESEKANIYPGFYVIAEKILSANEGLPLAWPVYGTTGYDFAKMANALFVDDMKIQALDRIYCQFTGSQIPLNNITYQKKKQVMNELFSGEMRGLENCLANLAHSDNSTTSLSCGELARALVEVTACLPIYRTYTRGTEVSPQDLSYLECALQETRRRAPDVDTAALNFLKRTLTLEFRDQISPNEKEALLSFVLRWQQLTGAVMAKGFEDTALYCYNRLISLNDVGSEPDAPGNSVSDFHHYIMVRQERWPYPLNATSTHDTKRSEDVRSRINVLSEIPESWEKHLDRWRQCNETKKQKINGISMPEPNTEMLIYQTLLGAWPLHENELFSFKKRMRAYMTKAAREAKTFTNWLSPDSEYESALAMFLESILDNAGENEFLEDFLPFEKQIAYYGALNSLAQVLLKITSPGIPDFYQGTELWDFSLVDPDNRRPVDFTTRAALLDELAQREAQGQVSLCQQVLNSWEDGRLKLYVTYKALNVREAYADIFQDGEYIPLQVAGHNHRHVCAFLRHRGKNWALVAIPRLLSEMVGVGSIPAGRDVWGEDLLLLPGGAPERWHNVFTGEELRPSSSTGGLKISDILHTFPVALLTGI